MLRLALNLGFMGRPPNMSISTWFRSLGIVDRPWVIDAHCGAHQELPWAADSQPDPFSAMQMTQVCEDCPVIAACAGYGLTTAGGFYAGVWLPWRPAGGGNESSATRGARRRGRNKLKRIASRTQLNAVSV